MFQLVFNWQEYWFGKGLPGYSETKSELLPVRTWKTEGSKDDGVRFLFGVFVFACTGRCRLAVSLSRGVFQQQFHQNCCNYFHGPNPLLTVVDRIMEKNKDFFHQVSPGLRKCEIGFTDADFFSIISVFSISIFFPWFYRHTTNTYNKYHCFDLICFDMFWYVLIVGTDSSHTYVHHNGERENKSCAVRLVWARLHNVIVLICFDCFT